jgi:hypothetical protein
MSQPPNDAGIPVLTEVIADAPAAPITPPSAAVPPMPADKAASMPPKSTAPTTADISFAGDEEKWERLERDIKERVLLQIQERVDFVLEQRVRDSLADVLQTAVEGLATEIRNGLQHTIQDVVARAVAQEISRLHSSKK